MKNKIIIVCIVLIVLVGAGIGGYQYWQYREEQNRIHQEKFAHSSDIYASVYYSFYFRLDSNMSMKKLYTVLEETYDYPDKYTGVSYVKDGTGVPEATEGEIIYFPGERTEDIIDNLNRYFLRESIDLSVYDLEYPLTIDDILTKRSQITRAIDDMPEESFSVVFE